jgi:hypothetical protein
MLPWPLNAVKSRTTFRVRMHTQSNVSDIFYASFITVWCGHKFQKYKTPIQVITK